jgi:hypothetical protein
MCICCQQFDRTPYCTLYVYCFNYIRSITIRYSITKCIKYYIIFDPGHAPVPARCRGAGGGSQAQCDTDQTAGHTGHRRHGTEADQYGHYSACHNWAGIAAAYIKLSVSISSQIYISICIYLFSYLVHVTSNKWEIRIQACKITHIISTISSHIWCEKIK